jgi:hypothetical protein
MAFPTHEVFCRHSRSGWFRSSPVRTGDAALKGVGVFLARFMVLS